MKTIFYNGQIYTGEEVLRQAFLVENGIFTAVGTDQEVFAYADPDAVRVDLLDPFLPLPGREELKDMIVTACKAVNSCGITSVQSDDYTVFRGIPFETVNSVFQELEESGRLTVRVYEQDIVESRAGAKLAASSYSWRTLKDSGVSVSNGSDCPVELPDVMRGIECAVTRTSLDGTGPYLPEQAFTVKEALDSFTTLGAEASFEEFRKGRIAPGYAADFTILEQNPFEVSGRMLHTIAVCSCYLGGKCVYNYS